MTTATLPDCALCGHPRTAERQHVCGVDCGIGVGERVWIDPDAEAFEYGGSAPHGGYVVAVRPNEFDVRFWDRSDGGGWEWHTWTFPADDVRPRKSS